MSEVKINEKIVVDEAQNVEIAIMNLTGKHISFELIRKFILNEKNTMFYLDRKLNSSMDSGQYTDFLWLDTGIRNEYGNPIMICLRNGLNGYVGHYTGTVKDLYGYMKSMNKKNAKEIEKNYSRFLSKYKNRSEERTTVYISDPERYAINMANQDSMEGQETAFSLAMKRAGIEIEEALVEEPEIVEVAVEEELTEAQNEITIGLLMEQMESMQSYIDELLTRIESNEKTTKEEIEQLKQQNKEYKKALLNIRLYNNEAGEEEELSEEEKAMGHNLLRKNEKILVLGNTDIRVAEMRAIARDTFGFEKADFEFITDYDKIKTASARIHSSDRFVAVIFGNCPHKVVGTGGYTSIIDEFKQREDCPISIDARNEAGGLKITKQSFRSALLRVYRELKEMQAA